MRFQRRKSLMKRSTQVAVTGYESPRRYAQFPEAGVVRGKELLVQTCLGSGIEVVEGIDLGRVTDYESNIILIEDGCVDAHGHLLPYPCHLLHGESVIEPEDIDVQALCQPDDIGLTEHFQCAL